ncbi:CTD small phosphatase-like protein 2 isoform X2 [Canna indica]|uniref:CTD small phosphatase-like protein 2 isoform X2 n=1 Tax=Canna indica TaxID=4628 RepID=A0AAQ3JME8_9LILI|nr:CTD small phosphatase-like protein 2 isoform X2 [Canna indica]
MPALRMKRKFNKGYVRLHNVHDRQKTKRSENLSSGISIEVDTSSQIYQDENGKLSNTVATSADELECNSMMTEPDGASASSKLLNLSSLSPDILSFERMDSTSTTITPELKTIFSPNFEDGDSQINQNNHGDGESPELPNLVADEGEDGNSTLTDYQSCSLLDICISESVPSLPFDSSMGFTDVSCQHYEFTNSDILIDMAEKYMMLPFLERAMETSCVHDDEPNQEIMLSSEDACYYLATHQEFDMNFFSSDLGEIECLNPLLVFRPSPDIPQAVPSSCPNLMPKEILQRKPITLVLDLDETLVHSTLEHCDDADFTFSVFFNMKEHTVYVRRRPFLQMFLERVAQMFEIVIFTASLSIYAAQLLDILDPDQKIISRRIYRESCVFSDGCYTKDLTVLEVDLAKVAIIDNSPQVFQLQVNNGIPIKSWFDDPSDHALVQLLPFLETLVDAEDVRPIIAKKFGNKE